jgi:hypothetical protein
MIAYLPSLSRAIAEVRTLSMQEIKFKSQAPIANILREEELKWYQRSKGQFILKRDSNTRYFRSVANDRHKKTNVFILGSG